MLSIAFWLLTWEVVALIVGEKLLLPTPIDTIKTLFSLMGSREYWSSILFSSERIAASYLFSFILALVVGIAGGLSERFSIFLSPLVKAMRSVPVASIVILALLWVKSRNLAVVVSVLVVFPVLYESVSAGIRNTDPSLLEAAEVYEINGWRRIRYFYIPSLFPYVENGVKATIGLCWKSAVAAEVIGLPSSSVGARLYDAKVYLASSELFAWTVTIVVLASLFEWAVKVLLSLIRREALK